METGIVMPQEEGMNPIFKMPVLLSIGYQGTIFIDKLPLGEEGGGQQ
jgi:hypothetical protein